MEKLSPVRRWLNIGFGLLLAAFAIAVFWPLIAAPLELRSFCASLEKESTLTAVRAQAEGHRFRLSPSSSGEVHIYDHRSLGKFSCSLQFERERLASATFSFRDD